MPAPTVLPGRAYQTIGRVSRAIFRYRAADLSTTPITGEAPTFTRTSAPGGALADSNGILRAPAAHAPRYEALDLDGDGVREAIAILLELQSTNQLLWTEQLDQATWAKGVGTSVAANALLAPDGTLSGDTLTFPSGSTENYALQTWAVADPENRSVVFSIFLKDGTLTEAGNGFAIQIRRGDTSEVSSYLVGDGTLKRGERVANGWTRWYAPKTFGSSTVGDNIQVLIRSNGVAGSYSAWGAQLENGLLTPTSYLKNDASATTRNQETLRWTCAAEPQAMTAYVRFIERGTVGIASSRVFELGSGTARFQVSSTAGVYQAAHNNGASSVTSSAAAAPAYGQRVELRVVLSATGTIQLFQTLDEGAEVAASASAALAFAAAWSDTILSLGSNNGATVGAAAVRDFTLAGGVRTLAQMRELL